MPLIVSQAHVDTDNGPWLCYLYNEPYLSLYHEGPAKPHVMYTVSNADGFFFVHLLQ